MKDPDQPDLNDPRRREYDFHQAMAAQRQMASGTFGQHHSAILPDADNPRGESTKSRLESMISEAVKSAVTQITTNVAGFVDSAIDHEPPKVVQPETFQAQVIQEAQRQEVVQPQPIKPQAEPIIVQAPAHRAETVQHQTPQMPDVPQIRTPDVNMVNPFRNEAEAPKTAFAPIEPQKPALQALQQMAPPERPIEVVRTGFRVAQPQQQAEDLNEPPKPERRAVPQWPTDRAAWGPSEPFLDPGGQTADPQKSAYQAKSLEQAMQFSEAMDSYGMAMGEFTEAVAESIRVLTRRVNDMTRAIQGEGYDIR